jgi:hypothetical protein
MWIKGLGLIKDAAKRPDMAGTADSCSPPRPPASLNPFSGALTQLYLMTCRTGCGSARRRDPSRAAQFV